MSGLVTVKSCSMVARKLLAKAKPCSTAFSCSFCRVLLGIVKRPGVPLDPDRGAMVQQSLKVKSLTES